jgi:cystathionine beta-lyase/cystathionine gamma-synthase
MSSKRPANQESESDPQELGFATRTIYSQKKVSDLAHRQTALNLCGRPFDPDTGACGPGNIAHDLNTGPTQVLEQKLAELEGTEGGLVTSSALAAFTTLVRSVLSPGDRMVTQKSACTATTHLMHSTLSRLGVEMVAIDLTEPSNLSTAMKDRARLLYVDTPSNPLNALPDIAGIADQGHAHGMIVAVDSTFASPALQRPIEHGADIVLHSLTKYINGHGDTVGGGLFSNAETIAWMRRTSAADSMTAISPDASTLILRGLKTLALRMERHSSTAHVVALTLEAHPAVSWVRYPFLPSHPQHAIARRQMAAGSGMIAFGLHAGEAGARRVTDTLQLIDSSASSGEVGSLICRSADLTRAVPISLRESAICETLGTDFIRLSIGLEDPEDLIDDLWQALARL